MTPDPRSSDPALAEALLDLDATHARVDELSDRIAELELENRELRRQLATQAQATSRPARRMQPAPHTPDRQDNEAEQR